MSYIKQSLNEIYFEYHILKPKDRSIFLDPLGFIKYLFSSERILKNKNSAKLTSEIRSFDDLDYKRIYKNTDNNISAISSQWKNNLSPEQTEEIYKLFNNNKREKGSRSQNIIHFENWKNNTILMSYFENCMNEIKDNTEDVAKFKLQNAYFINDEFGYETYAHKFHHDDVGLRMKAWFIIDAYGDIGLEYKDLPYSDLEGRRYGLAYDTYAIKNKDLNDENTLKLPAKKGIAYLLNTDIFHRGYMKPNSKRLAFVIEFINFDKMKKIDGLSDACHFNEDVSKVEFE